MKKAKRKSKHKYKVIVKCYGGNGEFAQNGDKIIKSWNTSNLLWFTKNFLDKKYPNWKWFNVYCKKDKTQIGSFTINNRPTRKYI